MAKDLKVRSSVEEFLVFKTEEKDRGINIRYDKDTLWMTQKSMAELFDTGVDNINVHLKKIYNEHELTPDSTIEENSIVRTEGTRKVKRKVKFYNLDAIISVGYRVNSKRATQFRRWATGVLRTFTIQGYVLDKERMENGTFLNEDYFERLLEEIKEIRISERRFYQKITDIYATSIDYDPKSPMTLKFFKTVQNKMHYAITHKTAPEIIYTRADSNKINMGLTTWKDAPDGKITKSDVVIAKNYLSKKELKLLERIVTMYLDYAEDMAERHIPMTMEDWQKRLDAFLKFNERDVLDNPGKVTHEIAKSFALSEFEKYRIIQDKEFKSDFDNFLLEVQNKD